MSEASRQAVAGRVGRAHGLDGSFYLDAPDRALERGDLVVVGSRQLVVERVAGATARPLIRLSEVSDRTGAEALRGEEVRVADSAADLAAGEYFAEDLVGCTVTGLGKVSRVIPGLSCDLLEVGEEGLLVPFIRDAVTNVDAAAGVIDVDRHFLGLGES